VKTSTIVTAFLLISASPSAFAAKQEYDLKMDLSMNGKHIASPRVLVVEGEKATVSQKSNDEEDTIEVTATEGDSQGRKGILLDFVVSVVGKDGKKKVVSRPRILTLEGEKATLSSRQNDASPEEVSLSVVATRRLQ
jgi:type II secretory pathway component GspD/PulD (secretin)